MVLIYVDDSIIASESDKLIDDFLDELGKTFELTSKKLEFFLGLRVNVSKDRGKIQINQASYIDEMLERFGMTKPSPIPIDVTPRAAFEGEVDLTVPYRELVGSLLYAVIASRAECVTYWYRYMLSGAL